MFGYIQEILADPKGVLLIFLLALPGRLLAISAHESAHAWVANRCGDPTARLMGRISLNPLKHLDPVGLLMMVLFGFGWAKPVPVDPRYFKDPKKGMAVTALAGPVSNLLLAAVLLLICRGMDLYAPYSDGLFTFFMFLVDTSVLSVGLGLFNLLPIPPLDGSKVLEAVLPDRAYYQLMRYERYGMLLLIVLSLMNVGGGLINQAIAAVWTGLYTLIF